MEIEQKEDVTNVLIDEMSALPVLWQPTMNLKWVKNTCSPKNMPILFQEFRSNTGDSKWVSVPVENKCKCKK